MIREILEVLNEASKLPTVTPLSKYTMYADQYGAGDILVVGEADDGSDMELGFMPEALDENEVIFQWANTEEMMPVAANPKAIAAGAKKLGFTFNVKDKVFLKLMKKNINEANSVRWGKIDGDEAAIIDYNGEKVIIATDGGYNETMVVASMDPGYDSYALLQKSKLWDNKVQTLVGPLKKIVPEVEKILKIKIPADIKKKLGALEKGLGK